MAGWTGAVTGTTEKAAESWGFSFFKKRLPCQFHKPKLISRFTSAIHILSSPASNITADHHDPRPNGLEAESRALATVYQTLRKAGSQGTHNPPPGGSPESIRSSEASTGLEMLAVPGQSSAREGFSRFSREQRDMTSGRDRGFSALVEH
ncbi:hypothetical protein RRG08_013613 [Elysia crispata]|uniref:Uncharacterized protein n=1 Tax=Elysia crispata TaxID=231223 RepID=A0AAE1AQL4_9GAST|nr:hypothetical protein RRG08_013613 [Elysia crispata]